MDGKGLERAHIIFSHEDWGERAAGRA